MRTYLKVISNIPHISDLIGHDNYACGAYGVTCDFCKARGKYVEAFYTVVYESDVYDHPQCVALCGECSKPAIEAIGITKELGAKSTTSLLGYGLKAGENRRYMKVIILCQLLSYAHILYAIAAIDQESREGWDPFQQYSVHCFSANRFWHFANWLARPYMTKERISEIEEHRLRLLNHDY